MNNYDRFKELLRSSNRDGVEDLITYLDSTDFAIAPASCNYHQNWEGGLCEHSLNVYDKLSKLISEFAPGKFDEASIILVALLHDLAKVNFYELYDKNVKVDGKWIQEKHYRVKDAKERFIFTNHEHTSLFIAQQFIPLSVEEQVAIATHHGGQGDRNTHIDVITDVYTAYKLPLYLHVADLMDAYE